MKIRWMPGRRPAAFAVVSVAVAITSLAAAVPASAAPYDGTNPHSTGCDTGATSVRSTNVDDSDRGNYGLLELRFSSDGCATAWARFTCETNSGPPQCIGTFTITLRRSDGKTETVSVFFPNWMGYQDQIYTLQLNDDYQYTAQACYTGAIQVCTGSF
jgi:hypothetical protein